MAKRTNRVAWGLVTVLAVSLVVCLAVGYMVWSANADTISVFLLKPRDMEYGKFGRFVTSNVIYGRPEATVEVIWFGVIRVVKVEQPRSAAGPPASSSSGTGQ